MKRFIDFMASEIEKDRTIIPGIQTAELSIFLSQLVYSFIYQYGVSKWTVMSELKLTPLALRRALNGDIRLSERDMLKLAVRVLKFMDSVKITNPETTKEIDRVREIVHSGGYAAA